MRLKTFLRKCLCCVLMLGLALWQIGCAETASTPMGGKPAASGTSKPAEKSDDAKGTETSEKPAVEQTGSTTGPGLGAEVPEPAAEKPAEEAKPAEKSEEKPKEE